MEGGEASSRVEGMREVREGEDMWGGQGAREWILMGSTGSLGGAQGDAVFVDESRNGTG